MSPIRDYEFLTLVRLRIAQGRWDEALRLLARFQTVVEGGARKAGQVEVHALRGLVLHAQNQTIEAVAALEHALVAAEPEGFIRVFVDEGEPMREILRIWISQADRHKNRTELQTRLIMYVDKLLAAYTHNLPELPLPETRINSSIYQITLDNPLTDRELEVLHLIAEGLSNLAIAQKLYLSPGTVKVHIKHMYGKFDVSSRTQAVVRLRELNLP